MSNDNNPFKSIEEKFLERQRAKQQTTRRTKNTSTPKSPFEVKEICEIRCYSDSDICFIYHLSC